MSTSNHPTTHAKSLNQIDARIKNPNAKADCSTARTSKLFPTLARSPLICKHLDTQRIEEETIVKASATLQKIDRPGPEQMQRWLAQSSEQDPWSTYTKE